MLSNAENHLHQTRKQTQQSTHLFRITFLYVGIAILVTSIMDHNGLLMFSALPLAVLVIAFKFHSRLSFKTLGFTFGHSTKLFLKAILIGILYPLLVMSTIVGLMIATGQMELEQLLSINWSVEVSQILFITLLSLPLVILTEEGFFRGVGWAGLRNTGASPSNTLLISSLMFSIWHISLITSQSDFRLEGLTAIVYLCNATLLGLIWGIMRMYHGSVLSSSLSHSLWNALAYTFFGFGSISAIFNYDSRVFSPETGYVGLFLNIVVFLVLYRKLVSGKNVEKGVEFTKIEEGQIEEYSSYFEHLVEFRAMVLRQIQMNSGGLYIDSPSIPTLLVYQGRMINVVLDLTNDVHQEDMIRSVQGLLRSNKLLVTNRDTWKEVFDNEYSARTIVMPQLRKLYSARSIDHKELEDFLEKMNSRFQNTEFNIRLLVSDDEDQVNSRFKRYYDMIDPVSKIIESNLLFGVFNTDSTLVGLAGPAHLPTQDEFEVQIVVDKSYRRRGLATWLSLSLLNEAFSRNLDPIWDAENVSSSELALKLGYKPIKEYEMTIYSSIWLKMLFSLRIHIIIGKIMKIISSIR